jgi:hypothetical protein
MLEAPPPKQKNPVLARSFSVHLLQFLQMRKRKTCLFRSALPLRIQTTEEHKSII